jgi:hypothetical protein
MHKPIVFRDWWSQYGFWTAILFALECVWLGVYGPSWVAFLMPFSITWSIATVIHLLTDRTAERRFWRPYVLKWLAWWIANACASAILAGIGAGMFCLFLDNEVVSILFIAVVLIAPTLRLIAHAKQDMWDVARLQVLRQSAGTLLTAGTRATDIRV